MATILAHIRVEEGTETELGSIARRLDDSAHGKESQVLRDDYSHGAEPRTYSTFLPFEDFHAFIAHQASEHHESASFAVDAAERREGRR
jgi:hypothetical protein